MDGTFYLFFVWGIWIFSTFLLEKNSKVRFPLAVGALTLLIVFTINITIGSIIISAPAIIMLLVGYYFTTKYSLSKMIYLLASVVTLSVGYTGFQLFEMYDPVWVFIDRRGFFCFFLFLFAYFIYPSSIRSRLIFICLGVIHGEIIFAIILSRLYMPYIIGSKECLDILSITSVLFILSQTLVKAVNISSHNSKKKLHQ